MLKAYQKLDITTALKKANLLGSNFFSEDFITQYIAENISDINPELL